MSTIFINNNIQAHIDILDRLYETFTAFTTLITILLWCDDEVQTGSCWFGAVYQQKNCCVTSTSVSKTQHMHETSSAGLVSKVISLILRSEWCCQTACHQCLSRGLSRCHSCQRVSVHVSMRRCAFGKTCAWVYFSHHDFCMTLWNCFTLNIWNLKLMDGILEMRVNKMWFDD